MKKVPKCRKVPQEVCQDVSKEQCWTEPKQTCWVEPKEKCWDVPEEICWDEPKEKCWKEPQEVCWQVGKDSLCIWKIMMLLQLLPHDIFVAIFCHGDTYWQLIEDLSF